MERDESLSVNEASSVSRPGDLIGTEPRVVDLNAVVSGIVDLLRRTLRDDVKVETILADNPWAVEIDPNQLQCGLLVLAVNARTMMPEGGKLTFETANTGLDDDGSDDAEVSPRQCVLVAVTDHGAGMPKEVLEKMFGPFIATQEAGVDRGLGLSTVDSMARQWGGHVEINSVVGVGTCVRLYLPRVRVEAAGQG